MTEKERKRLIKKWYPILETDIGKPITTQAEASVLATLMESQVKLNEGYLSKKPLESNFDKLIEMNH